MEGRFNKGFFGVSSLGAVYLEGLIYMEGLIFGILLYFRHVMSLRAYITRALRDNNLVTRAFKSDYGCAKIAVQ